MDQREFLDLLYEALQEEMPEAEVQTNIAYYKGYFSTEMEKGRSEQEIIAELGNPRLIAKTLTDSYKMEKMPWNKGYQEQTSRRYDEDKDFTQPDSRHEPNRIPWHYKLFAILAVILVVAAVIAIGSIALSLFFSVILPVLVGVLLIRLLWSALKK